jgi:hypothetical protein
MVAEPNAEVRIVAIQIAAIPNVVTPVEAPVVTPNAAIQSVVFLAEA